MDKINDYNNISETDDRRDIIKQKLRQYYDGRIVRKDLTKSIREGANVPVYVLEYLLGQYCNTDDPEIIDEGVDNVKRIFQLTQLEIFGTVCHGFLLLFLIPLLYQKEQEKPSKTALPTDLKVPKIQGKTALLYALFQSWIRLFLLLLAVQYQCQTSASQTPSM